MKNIPQSSTFTLESGRSALISTVLLIPFFLINAIIAQRIEPFFSLIRPGAHTSPQELFLLLFTLLLFPLAAYVAARPMFAPSEKKPKLLPINLALTILIAVVTILLWTVLGQEIYRCEVLAIPNCD